MSLLRSWVMTVMTAAQVISSLFTLEVDQTLTETSEVTTEVEKKPPEISSAWKGYLTISVFGVSPFSLLKEFIHCQTAP